MGRGKWDEKSGARKVRREKWGEDIEKSGARESGARKVGCEKWGREKWS